MNNSGVRIWVASLCGMVIVMVTLGGVTRLTGSGLSITEWKPILGAIPPLSEAAWQEAFSKYQQIPQFKLINSAMTLSEFKFIFFWEWFHRLWGRLIGLAFFMPWAFFLLRGKVSGSLAKRLFAAFVLGGLQGALGWFMVKSGLSERTSVSHYRLAAHLLLALAVLGYLFRIYLDLVRPNSPTLKAAPVLPGLVRASQALVALIVLQIFYGALVAGLKAGYGYNTFPLMMGQLLPAEAFSIQPLWLNALDNPALVQFIHRTLGWLTLGSVLGFALWTGRRCGDPIVRVSVRGLMAVVLLQFVMGVATLVWAVPLALGAVHQLGACALLVVALWVQHSLRRA